MASLTVAVEAAPRAVAGQFHLLYACLGVVKGAVGESAEKSVALPLFAARIQIFAMMFILKCSLALRQARVAIHFHIYV